jgi:hypothetical protein
MAVSTYQRMVQLLILSFQGKYRSRIGGESGRALPLGCLPLHEFQSPNFGGTAANVRMAELKRPEGDFGGKGIPIEKVVVDALDDGTAITRTHCYRLAVDPKYIDLSGPYCRLDRAKLAADGLQVEDFIDDSYGNPSRACRIVKINKLERIGQANMFANL